MEIKDINKIRNAAADPKAVIYVLATEELKKRIMNGSDPVVATMPKEASSILLEGKGMAVEGKMIIDWIDGRIDAKNKSVLDLCNIRIFMDSIELR
jgi:hypothetical protein